MAGIGESGGWISKYRMSRVLRLGLRAPDGVDGEKDQIKNEDSGSRALTRRLKGDIFNLVERAHSSVG